MNKCVLIYDDDKEILFLCKIMLQGLNYRVETLPLCGNIQEDVRNFKPDIILIDLWLPGTNGEQAVKLLKKDAATCNIPVILFSANADLQQICERIKADDYIEKPFDIQFFKDTIKKNIDAGVVKVDC